MKRHDQLLVDVLRLLGRSESLVPDSMDRVELDCAAEIIERNFRERQPRVLITGGYSEDPLTMMVKEMVQDVDEMRDTLAVLGDKIEELLRELKRGNREIV